MKTKLIYYLLLSMLWGVFQTTAQECRGFKTYSMGGWGTRCYGNNPGCYRDATFTAAFPGGVKIGTAANGLLLSTSDAVALFLPSGSVPSALNGNLVNPGSSYSNVLAGQLVALTLSVGFDAYDANFATNPILLGSLKISSGTFAGKSVTEFLAMANAMIGSSGSSTSYAQLNATAKSINENFENGTTDHGFLTCPPVSCQPLQITHLYSMCGSLCSLTPSGKETVVITGGTAPFTFTLSNGTVLTSQNHSVTFTGLVAANYTVTVTDAHGLVATGANAFTISQPVPLTSTYVQTNPALCSNATGSVTVTPAGGTAPYTILWSNGSTAFTNSNLVAGTYSYIIFDANACHVTGTATLSTATGLDAIHVVTNASCFGANNCSITTTVSGGTAPYTVLWSNGSTSFSQTNLPAGTYSAVITDALGCQTTTTVTAIEPPVLTLSTNVVTADCTTGAAGGITATATGGSGPYSYLWNNGSTNPVQTNLAAGTYTCTVTDASACTATLSALLSTTSTTFAVTDVISTVSCFGESDGSIVITPTLGTAPYAILWSDGSTAFTLPNLAAGTYTATITDALGCTTTISETVAQPLLLTAASVGENATCCTGNNGTATVTPDGGTAPYTILWSNGSTAFSLEALTGGTYTYTVTDANECSTSGSVTILAVPVLVSTYVTTPTTCTAANASITVSVSGGTLPYSILWSTGSTAFALTNLAAGTYTYTVSDANNCQTNGSIPIEAVSGLAVTDTLTNPTCFGGTTGAIVVTPSLGTAPYTILWLDGSTTFSLNNLVAGTYSATITDALGCTVSFTETLSAPLLLTSTAVGTNATCCTGNNGTATVTPVGGTAPYTILWSTGSALFSLEALVGGTYTYTVTDANGCTTGGFVAVLAVPVLVSTYTTTPTTCLADDASITVTAAGGTLPYAILWSNGSTAFTLTTLAGGVYTYTVTDANGCQTNGSVTIVPTPGIESIHVLTNASCFAANNCTIATTVTGGTAPYTILWSNGSTAFVQTNLPAGTYTAVVTDANGCFITTSVTVTEPPVLALLSSVTNVTCTSGTNGSITASASGGTAPYSYLWNTGSTNPVQTNLTTGNYTCTVTDGSACTTTLSVSLALPADLVVTDSFTNAGCFGGTNGTIQANVTGGTAPYTILWSNGSTAFSQINLTAGTYSAVVTDGAGCTVSLSETLLQSAAITYTSTQNDVSCNGRHNGTISVTPAGGTAPYTILWSTGKVVFSLNNLVAGTYTALLTDALGCTATVSVTLTEPTDLVTTRFISNVTCNGAATGIATVTPSGGTAPYTILWSNGATTFTSSNLLAAIYTAVVTDAHGCTTKVSANVTQPSVLWYTQTIGGVSCNAGSNGSIIIVPKGGKLPYTILWSSGATTFSLTGLVAGAYAAVITDANGCTVPVAVTVVQPASALVATASATAALCGVTSSGSVTATAAGGTAPYTILWSNGATSFNVTGLAAGTYSAVLTDAHGCTASTVASVVQPIPLVAEIAHTDVSCYSENNGTTTVSVLAGEAPYTILWSTGDTTFSLGNLTAGTYTAVVTAANGCTTSVSATINQPAAALASTQATTTVSCFGSANGSVTVSATGGTAPYTILWSTGATSFVLANLASGTYTAFITDANACYINITVTVGEPTLLTSSQQTTNVSCFEGTNGSATVTAAGGTAPYTILWSNGGTSFTASNLVAGTYTAVLTDANGCTAAVSATVAQPTLLTYSQQTTNVSCFEGTNGSDTVIAVGGTAPYTILWSNGGTSFTASNLSAGTYTAVLTDANGCTAAVSATIVQPTLLTSTQQTTNVSCFEGTNGSTTVTAVGGTAPYTILWSNGETSFTASNLAAGTYTAVLTDANGCTAAVSATVGEPTVLTSTQQTTNVSCFEGTNGSATVTAAGGTAPYTILWSNGETSFTASNLVAGTYTAVLTDANGCTTDVSATVAEPTLLTSSQQTTNVSCFEGTNGSAAVTAAGGTSPYTILWSNGGTSFTASNLSAGTYTAVLTDANGCTTYVSATVAQPTLLTSTQETTNVTCYGGASGTATVTAVGGTAPYTILWSNGGTSFTASNLVAGTYTAVLTDANGCTAAVSATVAQPTVLSATASSTDASCTLSTSGTATATVSGGTAPYTILWSNGGTSFTVGNLSAGTYTALVTDAKGCTTDISATVSQPTALVVATTHTNVSCYAGNNGSITATVAGAPASYTILWSTGQTTFSIANLTAGTYTAVVNGANGCTATLSVTVTQPATALALTMSQTPIMLLGGYGTATATVTGGTAPYTYSWNSNPAQTTQTASLQVGWYIVTVTDANGCSVTGNVTLLFGYCKGFMTATKDLYAAPCNGDSIGCYMNDHFLTSFPQGLVVGSPSRAINFTRVEAIRNFLNPANAAAPKMLNQGTLLNPTCSEYSNALVSEVITTTLNMAFGDNADFSTSGVSLGALTIRSGAFEGKTVRQVLALANTALGNGVTAYSLTDITAALAAINTNYVSGSDNNFLKCPTEIAATTEEPIEKSASFIVFPNPVIENANIEFALNNDTNVEIQLYSINGQLVTSVFNGKVKSGEKNSVPFTATGMKSGVYFMKIITDTVVETKSVIVGQ